MSLYRISFKEISPKQSCSMLSCLKKPRFLQSTFEVGQAVPDTTKLIGRPRQAQPDLLTFVINFQARHLTK